MVGFSISINTVFCFCVLEGPVLRTLAAVYCSCAPGDTVVLTSTSQRHAFVVDLSIEDTVNQPEPVSVSVHEALKHVLWAW